MTVASQFHRLTLAVLVLGGLLTAAGSAWAAAADGGVPCQFDGGPAAQCGAGEVCSAEGVCCDKVCELKCESCRTAGFVGTCTTVAAGVNEPNGRCGPFAVCTRLSVCSNDPMDAGVDASGSVDAAGGKDATGTVDVAASGMDMAVGSMDVQASKPDVTGGTDVPKPAVPGVDGSVGAPCSLDAGTTSAQCAKGLFCDLTNECAVLQDTGCFGGCGVDGKNGFAGSAALALVFFVGLFLMSRSGSRR